MITVHSCRTTSFVCVVVITRRSRGICFLFALQSRVPPPTFVTRPPHSLSLPPLAPGPSYVCHPSRPPHSLSLSSPATPLRRRGGSALLIRLSSRGAAEGSALSSPRDAAGAPSFRRSCERMGIGAARAPPPPLPLPPPSCCN